MSILADILDEKNERIAELEAELATLRELAYGDVLGEPMSYKEMYETTEAERMSLHDTVRTLTDDPSVTQWDEAIRRMNKAEAHPTCAAVCDAVAESEYELDGGTIVVEVCNAQEAIAALFAAGAESALVDDTTESEGV